MKTVLKGFKYLILLILLLLVLANGMLLGKRLITHEIQPTVFGWSWAEVLSGSMEPAISTGDLVVFHQQDSYEPGDIITYLGNSHGITHRITEVLPEGYRTKGDNNNTPDEELVLPQQVVGKVVLVIPKIGNLLAFFRTPMGMAALLLSGAAIIELPEMFKRRKASID